MSFGFLLNMTTLTGDNWHSSHSFLNLKRGENPVCDWILAPLNDFCLKTIMLMGDLYE